ncbi:MAG: FxLYD domain-containing protein [Patescibacteria group bacterium]
MSWATRRRTIIFSIIVAVLLIALVSILFPVFYKAPSCTDQKMNGKETGIDCGGTCTYLCSAEVGAAAPRFVRPFSPSAGRTDVISYIDNPNKDLVAKDVHYTVELYGTDATVIARKEGITDILPGATPVYIPNFTSGYAVVARAFLSFDDTTIHWYRYEDQRVVPKYNFDAQIQGTTAPRIMATLTNPSAKTLRDITVVATVFDASGNAIAATQTVIPTIPPQGISGAVFTWNEPFAGVPARIDIVPVVPLPALPTNP